MRARYFFAPIVLLTCLVVLFPVALFGQTPQSYSWSTTPPNVASVSWTNQQIGTFLDSVTGSSVPFTVSDFVFNDLDGDGQLELLATVDFSGRQLFNTVVVVRRQANNFTVQQIEALGVQTLQGIFADLNHDGHQELLVPTAITPYLGAVTPQGKWTAIYGWSGSLWIDVTNQFSAYYQSTILPILKQNLTNLQATSPGSLEVDIAQIDYDKAVRVSGQDPTAGLTQATGWASSTDPTYRIFAAAILADIGTTSATSILNTLKTDQDPQVVIYAAAAFQSLSDFHFTSVGIKVKSDDEDEDERITIKLNERGKLLVTVLSTPTFDAYRSIDHRSLKFGSAGTEDSLVFCKSHDHNDEGDHEDTDDPQNLMCYFDLRSSSFQLGDAAAVLRGKLKNGTAIKGTVPVVIVAGEKEKNEEPGS